MINIFQFFYSDFFYKIIDKRTLKFKEYSFLLNSQITQIMKMQNIKIQFLDPKL